LHRYADLTEPRAHGRSLRRRRRAHDIAFGATDEEQSAENTVTVVDCALHPTYALRNRDRLRPDAPSDPAQRCGLYMPSRTVRDADTEVDFAVLWLSRPLPHSVADPVGTAAGQVMVTPERIVETPPALGASFTGTAVGFGGTTLAGGGTGTRRVRVEEFVMGNGVVERAFVTSGQDSGGPLFLSDGSSRAVVAVSSSQIAWGALDRATVRDWIGSRLDEEGDGRADIFCPRGTLGSDPLASAENDRDGDGHLDGADTCPQRHLRATRLRRAVRRERLRLRAPAAARGGHRLPDPQRARRAEGDHGRRVRAAPLLDRNHGRVHGLSAQDRGDRSLVLARGRDLRPAGRDEHVHEDG
jgi:hypothetical protein